MPALKGLLRSLKKSYGEKKGKNVYYAMENKAGGSSGKLRSALKSGKFSK